MHEAKKTIESEDFCIIAALLDIQIIEWVARYQLYTLLPGSRQRASHAHQLINQLTFSLDGPGEIVATDNGDAASMVSFASPVREAFNGRCLVIVRSKKGQPGTIRLLAQASGVAAGSIALKSVRAKPKQ